jgi:LysM repeat protein
MFFYHSFMMKILSLSSVIVLAGALSLQASSKEQEQEYVQVRKIALKDAGVRAAFEKANEKLEQRIIEIDPSLKPYVERNKSTAARQAKTTPAAPAKHSAHSRKPPGDTATHIVARGETLTTIAAHYKISTLRLKRANNITGDRKLRVGQKLVIPQSKASEATPGKSEGLWDSIRKSFD